MANSWPGSRVNPSSVCKLTFEKHAPICTFGVGGSPLLIGLGGVCLFRSLLLGGTGGVSDNKSGLILSLSRSADISLSPEINWTILIQLKKIIFWH